MQTEQEVASAVHPSVKAAGADLGVCRTVALSDGTYISPINAFQATQVKLARLQRRLAKKVKS